jgi:hypothetical protein
LQRFADELREAGRRARMASVRSISKGSWEGLPGMTWRSSSSVALPPAVIHGSRRLTQERDIVYRPMTVRRFTPPSTASQTGIRVIAASTALCVAAKGDLDDDDQLVIPDGVQNPVPTLSNPVLLSTGELLGTFWTWVACKFLYPIDDPAAIGLRQSLNVLHRRRLDAQFIVCHAVANP